MTAAGFLACHWSPWFISVVIAGLAMNWFGDLLDGSLARHRAIERPRYGFLLDHSSDLIAQSLIVVGLGVSPYFTLPSALFVLSLYLSDELLHLSARRDGRRASPLLWRHGRDGVPHSRRLLDAVRLLDGPRLIEAQVLRFAGLDVAVGAMSALAFTLFVAMVRQGSGADGGGGRCADGRDDPPLARPPSRHRRRCRLPARAAPQLQRVSAAIDFRLKNPSLRWEGARKSAYLVEVIRSSFRGERHQ